MLKHLLVLMALCASCSGGEDVVFKVIPGSETGLEKIIGEWAAEELAAQGGKYQGHGWWLWGLTPIDYDNDGDPDLVPTHHGMSGGIIIKNMFKETGKLEFKNVTKTLGLESRKLPNGVGRRTIACDLNGDGWLDLLGIRSPHYLNEKGQKFTPVGKEGFNTIHAESMQDINGDGYPDVIERNTNALWDPKTQAFKAEPRVHPRLAKIPTDVKALFDEKMKSVRFYSYEIEDEHDLNGDGIADVVMGGFAGYSGNPLGRYLIADKDGALVDKTAELGLPLDSTPILVGDINGDERVDVLAAQGKSAGLYIQQSDGKFVLKAGPVTDFATKPGPYLQRAYAVDFAGRRKADLVLSNPRLKSTQILTNLGEGEYKQLHSTGSWDSDPIAICDINDDGLLDVVVGGPENSITIFLNQSPAPGTICGVLPRMEGANRYAVGARVEAYAAGMIGSAGLRPIASELAHPDASPVQIALATESSFDMRITFPGKEPRRVEYKNVMAKKKLKATPDGKVEEIK